MTRTTAWSVVLLTLALSACATATHYKAAGPGEDYGYSSQKLEDNRYRITFKGNSRTDRETVQNYLLYRAAELALEQNADYFIAVGRDTDRRTRETTHYTGVGLSPFVFGIGLGGGTTTSSSDEYSAFGEITLHSGAKPSDNPNAYDARQIKANLESDIRRKP